MHSAEALQLIDLQRRKVNSMQLFIEYSVSMYYVPGSVLALKFLLGIYHLVIEKTKKLASEMFKLEDSLPQ